MAAGPRHSMAFAFVEDMIQISRHFVQGLCIPATKKEEILQDLQDTEAIMEARNFGDMEAIDEAITALTYVNDYVKTLSGELQLKESLEHILQWLNYIKKMMAYSDLGDTRVISNYYYTNDVGNIVYPGLDESDTHFA